MSYLLTEEIKSHPSPFTTYVELGVKASLNNILIPYAQEYLSLNGEEVPVEVTLDKQLGKLLFQSPGLLSGQYHL